MIFLVVCMIVCFVSNGVIVEVGATLAKRAARFASSEMLQGDLFSLLISNLVIVLIYAAVEHY